MEYREQLSFSKELPFGIEIEVCNKNIKDMNSLKNEKNIRLQKDGFAFESKKNAIWKYEHENTNELNQDLGLEVISPILHNEKTDLIHLKTVLQFLQKINAEVNEICGIHIHMGSKVFQKEMQKLYNFFLFYLYYEPVFYKFSAMGNFGHIREYAYSYANPVVLQMQNELSIETLKNYIKENSSSWHKENALHFKEFSLFDITSSFELRVFNGTLNECIIENYINMTLSSLEYALSTSFSQEEYQTRCLQILKVRREWLSFKPFLENADSLVDEFVNTIFNNTLDKDSFYEQYKGLHL